MLLFSGKPKDTKDTKTTADKPDAPTDKASSQKATEPVKKEDKDFTKIVDIVAGKTLMMAD